MSKILAVFGATGQQGGSVINYVLNDPELSENYKIRAITLDAQSENAKQLKEKVEVVRGDVLNRASVETALTGEHTVFAMTTPSFGPDAWRSSTTVARRSPTSLSKKMPSTSSSALCRHSQRALAASTPRSPPSTPWRKPSSTFEAFPSRAPFTRRDSSWRISSPRPSWLHDRLPMAPGFWPATPPLRPSGPLSALSGTRASSLAPSSWSATSTKARRSAPPQQHTAGRK